MRLGTRGSALALAQSNEVVQAIKSATGRDVELVKIATVGDRSSEPITELGVGVFVSALRDALLAKDIDLAVHSYKDLPTAVPDGLVVAALPPRADPRDALVARDGMMLNELPDEARIGTGSLRRIAQLHALGRRLQPVPVRGNVDTRLRKVSEGELDAVVVARAGLARLGRVAEISETLDPLLMLPAPAQGALAVECRADDTELVELLRQLDDPATRATVGAERGLLADLQAGCSAPVAALAEVAEGDDGPEIYLRAAVLSLDGAFAVRLSRTATLIPGQDTAGIGRLLARDLRAEGADTILGVPR